MKIKYQFANETVTIEVEDQWATVLVDLDREEYNDNHRETRRYLYPSPACIQANDIYLWCLYIRLSAEKKENRGQKTMRVHNLLTPVGPS